METLLEWKEKIRHFYSKNEIYVVPIIKFFLAFSLFSVKNFASSAMIDAFVGFSLRAFPLHFFLPLFLPHFG